MTIETAGELRHLLERAGDVRHLLERPGAAAARSAPWRVYLRPAKWAGAIRRRAFAAKLPARVVLHSRSDIERVGTAYGGWPVPLGLISNRSIVYSVGAGEDVSFDLGLVERCGCEVHSFDPTDGAARHVARTAHGRLAFHQVAVWTHNGVLRMHRAADPAHIALSAVNLQRTRESVDVPCRTVESLRAELGHERIDLLKLTVDGGEYDLVPRLQLARWRTRVLIVAFHHNRPARAALDVIAALRADGMVPVARRDTAFTFVRRG